MLRILCALALSSICETDMSHCQDLAKQIAEEMDPERKAALEAQFKQDCPVEDPQGSGGHGPTVPN